MGFMWYVLNHIINYIINYFIIFSVVCMRCFLWKKHFIVWFCLLYWSYFLYPDAIKGHLIAPPGLRHNQPCCKLEYTIMETALLSLTVNQSISIQWIKALYTAHLSYLNIEPSAKTSRLMAITIPCLTGASTELWEILLISEKAVILMYIIMQRNLLLNNSRSPSQHDGRWYKILTISINQGMKGWL